MLKWALIPGTAVLLCACSDGLQQAKDRLTSNLVDNREVEFQNVEAFPGDVVCGEYLSYDAMRGGGRFRRFIVWGETADSRPSADDWKVLCNPDPASALLTNFGIGPLDDADNQLALIRADLTQLEAALALYLADNFLLPSTEQGLAALVAPTTTPPLPRNFKPDGYLPAPLADPWGRPYLYERGGLGGVAQEFRLYTLGADGLPGGTGKNADVGRQHLKYLDHIDP